MAAEIEIERILFRHSNLIAPDRGALGMGYELSDAAAIERG